MRARGGEPGHGAAGPLPVKDRSVHGERRRAGRLAAGSRAAACGQGGEGVCWAFGSGEMGCLGRRVRR